MHRRRILTWTLLFLAAAVLIAFFPCFRAGFTNLDDDRYVTDNPHVKQVSAEHIARFFHTFYVGCYLPVTMLTFMAEHALYGLNPHGFHATNVILHLVNALLVFRLAALLYRFRRGKPIEEAALWLSAGVVAFLFALHPLRVECVAWISARKDVLYAVFYLGALIAYVHHVRKALARDNPSAEFSSRMSGSYGAAFGLFLLSLLSKPMAVTLPFVCVLIDGWARRPRGRWMIWEKIPFFLLGLVFSIVAYNGQKSAEAMDMVSTYTLPECFLMACHGVVLYLWKTLAPFGLSVLYLFPRQVPLWFAYAPLLLGLLGVMVVAGRKRAGHVAFGAAFFLLTIFPVLKLVPIGEAIIADRYTYLPCLGLFFPLGAGVAWLWARSRWRPVLGTALVIVGVGLMVLTWQRCGVWRDNFTLWNDVLAKGQGNATVYTNLSNAHLVAKNLPAAIEMATRAIELDPQRAAAWGNRALAHLGRREFDQAIADYTRAVERNPSAAPFFHNRGEAYLQKGQFEKVIEDCTRAIALEPFAVSYFNRAVAETNLGHSSKALEDLSTAIRLDPGDTRALFYRGMLLLELGRPAEAWRDLRLLKEWGYPVGEDILNRIPPNIRQGS